MNDEQRRRYFGHYWPAACQANKWRKADDLRRRHVVAECMAKIRGLQTKSSSDLGEDEVTALFCYLTHLADPASLDKAARWVDCQKDYHAFNRARQSDWHERATYGTKGNKLSRDRFQGERAAVAGPIEEFNPEKIYKRHVTFASRHQKKQRAGEFKEAALRPQQPVRVPDQVAVEAELDGGNPF